jgi:hypothetical protein
VSIPGTDTILAIAGGLTTLTIFVTIWRWLRNWGKRVGDFLDDWNGEPARPGVPERPGVMQRLADNEEAHKITDQKLDTLCERIGALEQAALAAPATTTVNVNPTQE